MLKLVDIKKDYVMTDETVHALKGVSVNFRRNEFVAILGQSGCGKTTLLNIIGGLDRYTSGDLIIEGKSTKDYKDGDWDTYRNHSIGFIFQSYNLINHINILKNVELALTISGISKKERKARAEKALEMVGLKGKGRKKPNQLSGGQMQRVAIARALINNPEIVLADEPTGALDSETSIQIMDLLKEVAKKRLVIMVTHNPELAKQYATRIVNVKDGEIIGDSNPYDGETSEEREVAIKEREKTLESKGSKRQSSMSFLTALALSFNNLMSKMGRTILISFAGSIGIIGITLILSLSYGFSNYIMDVQTNAMSTYPLEVERVVPKTDIVNIMFAGSSNEHVLDKFSDSSEIHENSMLTDMISQIITSEANDTKQFKSYLDNEEVMKEFEEVTSDIQFEYSQKLNIYATRGLDGGPITKPTRLAPINSLYTNSYVYQGDEYHTFSGDHLDDTTQKLYDEAFPAVAASVADAIAMVNGNPFGALLDNQPLIEEQFDVLKGHFPTAIDEVVVKLNQFNEISDLYLYGMGLKDISYMMGQYAYSCLKTSNPEMAAGVHKPADDPVYKTNFDEMMGLEFALVNNTQCYKKVEDSSTELGYYYESILDDNDAMVDLINSAFKLKVVGIVRPKKGMNATSFSGAIGYHPDLYDYLASQAFEPTDPEFIGSNALKDQLANVNIDVLTGNAFDMEEHTKKYQENLDEMHLGNVDMSTPSSIKFFPKNFADKTKILELIDKYNATQFDSSKKIKVSDSVGAMLDSVQMIVSSVTYVLIAFVSISLLVSSIMIGIITYVSVLERTKEIGVLRSIGARKKDISRVFNAETLIIGLIAGLLGIGIAAILNIPIMVIINSLTDIGLTVMVPWYGAVALPLISIILTIIAGLIPSSIAAKKDPVIALRTE